MRRARRIDDGAAAPPRGAMIAGVLGEEHGTGFHQRRVFQAVVAATLAVSAMALSFPEPGLISVVVVVVTVAVLGIPHGAVDHLVATALGGPFDTTSRRRFTRDYLLVMLGVGVVWLVAPALALAVFLVASVHHFGQSDLAYLSLPRRRSVVVQWSRGLLLVALPLVAHLEAVSPVIERLGGADPASWGWLADRSMLWSAGLVLQHVVVGWALARQHLDRPTLTREAITVVALTSLLLIADPLIGFAVYFGLWHSLAHLFVLADLLGTQPAPLRSVARLAAPLSAVSILAMVAFIAGAAVADRTDLIVPLTFVFVSMLTMPHLLVVERLWAPTSARTRSEPQDSVITAAPQRRLDARPSARAGED